MKESCREVKEGRGEEGNREGVSHTNSVASLLGKRKQWEGIISSS